MSYCTLAEAIGSDQCPMCTMELLALCRVVETARAAEARMTAEAREVGCDLAHDEHEQLRAALRNLEAVQP